MLSVRQSAGAIAFDTNFLQAGTLLEVGLVAPYVQDTTYFAYVFRSKTNRLWINPDTISSRKATEQDSLVKKGLLDKGNVVVSLRIPDSQDRNKQHWDAGFWSRADLFIYTCRADRYTPASVSRTTARLSPGRYSTLFSWLAVILAYLLAALALGTSVTDTRSLFAFLNPVKITAGPDGRGSLSKLQILFFSLVVFGLIGYFLLRTGVLSDISTTVLLLLGIAGVGATAAKGADAQRTTISADNRGWLMRKGWLPATPGAAQNVATWRDLFSTDGEFDVYRYQSFIFSIAVGGALLAGGVAQLSSFVIPETLLGILGLSQVVYIGGKLVTPTTMTDLNKSIAELRDLERKFRDAAYAAKSGTPATLQEAVSLVGKGPYDTYVDKAKDVSVLYTSLTGLNVPDAGLQPSFN